MIATGPLAKEFCRKGAPRSFQSLITRNPRVQILSQTGTSLFGNHCEPKGFKGP